MSQTVDHPKKDQPYYEPDSSYDHRYYETPWYSYIVYVVLYIVIYATAAAIFAGLFWFGLYTPKWMGVFNLLVFGFTILFLTWMIYEGSKANKLKREHDFWLDQIAL